MSALWIIIGAAILAGLQALLIRMSALKRLKYSRYFSKENVYEGERVQMVEVLRNDKLLPVPWVRIEADISTKLRFADQENLSITGNRFHKSFFFLAPFRQITRRHDILCMGRGFYSLDSASFTAGDLFGIGNVSVTQKLDAKLYVYPLILDISQVPIDTTRWQGDALVQRWILPDPFLISGVRDYRHGDTLRDVHWRATARMGRLQVRQRDFTAMTRIAVLLNIEPVENLWGMLDERGKERMEIAIRYCATLCAWAVRSGCETGLYSNAPDARTDETIDVPPACSEEHLDEILKTLCHVKMERRVNFRRYLEQLIDSGVTGMDFAVVSCYENEALWARIQTLRRMGNTVMFVPVPEKEGGELHAKSA